MGLSNKIDKSAFKIIKTVTDLDDEIIYWLNKTPQERLDAVEFLRQQYILQHKLSNKMDKTIVGINYGK
jgi:hypothetical protein